MTERTNNKGVYTATVTEALTGVHEVRLTDASDNTIANYVTESLVDDTGTYRCHEFIASVDDLNTVPATLAALNDISVSDILTTQMTEAYAADGTAPTLAQLLFLVQQSVGDFSISGTTLTVKKLDGSTTAAEYTLNNASDPTSRTRSS